MTTETKKLRKQKHLEYDTQKLKDAGVWFQPFNNGVHLQGVNFDFWPSTGTWISKGKRGFGVDSLLKAISKNEIVSPKKRIPTIRLVS